MTPGPVPSVRATIALGSNLDDPEDHVRSAIDALDDPPALVLVATSALYRTDPIGPPGQPDYCNAVVDVHTRLSPLALLERLQAIEVAHGRAPAAQRRPGEWEARPLDLDILLFNDRVIRHPRLQVPHPRLHRRAFVLVPLAELDPLRAIPGHGRVCDLLRAVGRDGVHPWESA